MSIYPNDFDSDLEIQRVDNNVSEISGDTINSLRDAIFIVQKTLGINPHGNKNSLGDRIGISIDANGLIKASALEGIGILTLPVINSHIGVTAGIVESKLALNYSTQSLKSLIDSMRTDITGISSGISTSTVAFNSHILGTGNFHDGYHIKVNTGTSVGVAGLEAITIGDAINELGALLVSGNETIIPHIDTGIPSSMKHRASTISVNTTGFTNTDRTATNVQLALDSIDASAGALGISHVDNFHANGVLKETSSGTYYNSNKKLLDTTSGVSYTEGTGVIKITGVTSFSTLNISSGDILEIAVQSGIIDSGTYQIRAVGPLVSAETLGGLPVLDVDELAIFHVFGESRSSGDNVSATIYSPSVISSEFAPLVCSVRNNETIVDTISILDPGVARVVSVGFNGDIINSDGYELAVKIGLGSQLYRDLIITGLQYEKLGTNQSNPVSATSVAERINAFVSDPDEDNHFPITAYRIGNELTIAHNWVGEDYTIEIVDGYTGNYPLGLDAYGAAVTGQEIVGNVSNTYSINGTILNSLQTTFDGYASISSDSSTFVLWTNSGTMINPLRYGIGAGSVIHISGHQTLNTNGSYTVYTANSTSVSLLSPEQIDAPVSPTTFNVSFTASNVSLSDLSGVETDKGIVQVLVDSNGKTYLHQRLYYGSDLGSGVEITNISSGFPIGDVSLLVGLDGDFIEFNIIDDSLAGNTARIYEDFEGSFKLYHPNNIDYFTIRIIPGTIPGGIEVVTVNNSIPEDEAFLLCTGHFDGTLSITNVIDNRLFGNISNDQIRDDFVELFSQRPVSDLRSDGIVRGFDLMDIPYTDSITEMPALPLRGGIAYINGVRVSVETQKVIIQSYDAEGTLIDNARRIVGINDFGSIQVFSDELGEILTDGYNSSAIFGKILPLYYVTITNGGINDVIDIRRFINNIDEKLEIIVDETNNVVGNFRSLEGALLYAEKYPGGESLTIKIINSVSSQSPLVVPDGVSIIGGSSFGGGSKHQIINTTNHNDDFITLMGNNRIKNVEIISTTVGLQGSLVAVNGSNVDVEKCLLRFGDSISSNSADIGIKVDATENVRLTNNRIDNIFTGISSETGCNNLEISNNKITGVSGIGISCGIKIGTTTRSVDNMSITNNIINIDSTASTDLRAIFIDVGETIRSLKITGNNIFGALDINSENYLSNGIRVLNASSTGNKVTQLTLLNNYIQNVKLHDSSVYGIFIEDIEHALVAENTLDNVAVYDVNSTNTAFMWIGTNVDTIEINNNMLKSGEALRGIYIADTSTLVSIVGNTLLNIGSTSAMYIYGLSHRANVSDNKLIGSGDTGVWWKGERSKVSNNHLSSSAPLTDYAFVTGIYAQASYVDIVNNTVSDMILEDSVGIKNSGTTNEGMKVLGNTIEGTKMSKLIDLNGNYHTVSGNRLKNDLKSVGGETYFVFLGSGTPDSISIIGNMFEGIGSACIYSVNEVTNISITNNMVLTTSLTMAPFKLTHASVENCFVSGNKLPIKSTWAGEENVIGPTPAYGVLGSETFNYNTIGINRGMLDTRSISACDGASGNDISNASVTNVTEYWVMYDDGSSGYPYWELNPGIGITQGRFLYFPISGLPNGAELVYAQLQGESVTTASASFKFHVYKQSVKSGLNSTLLITSGELEAETEFSNSTTTSRATIPSGQIVNYEENSYYIMVEYSGADPTGNYDNIRVYGATITFRY